MASDHENSSPERERERVGICVGCRFMLEQGTKRGGIFFRCTRADEDETFKRYPAIPVLDCHGFEERGAAPGMA